jgi:hypothetical protein
MPGSEVEVVVVPRETEQRSIQLSLLSELAPPDVEADN